MKKIPSILLGAMLLLAPVTFTGCTTTQVQKAEVVSYKTIKASDEAASAALKAWAVRYVKRERDNEATRATDPGGYLERRNALIREEGKVIELKGKYTEAVTSAVNVWVDAKKSGQPVTSEPLATAAINELVAKFQEYAR